MCDGQIKQDFFVVKIAKFSYTSKDHLNYLDEIYHHCQIEHQRVSQYFGYSLRDFEGKNHLSFVMKYYQNSSLQTFLSCNKSVKRNWNTSIQIVITGIANGMKYLHSVGITHGSLRPSQIMLDENEEPHISDIDFSQIVQTHFSQEYFQSKIYANEDIFYTPPEILLGEECYFNQTCDVYSFGILLYEIITKSKPYSDFNFKSHNIVNFIYKIANENYRPIFPSDNPIKSEYKNLIERCWSRSPSQRPTFDEIYRCLTTQQEYELSGIDRTEYEAYIEKINSRN